MPLLVMAVNTFSEFEFEQACKELEEQDTEGYEFFTESHDVKIYRQYSKVTSTLRKNELPYFND